MEWTLQGEVDEDILKKKGKRLKLVEAFKI
jgi:hypothetical protein